MNIQPVLLKYEANINLIFNERQILHVNYIFMPDLINHFIHTSRKNIFLFLDA